MIVLQILYYLALALAFYGGCVVLYCGLFEHHDNIDKYFLPPFGAIIIVSSILQGIEGLK